MRAAVLALAVTAPLALSPQALATVERPVATSTPPPISDRVIVVWEPGTSSAERVAARAGADATLVRTLGAPRFQLVDPEPGQSPADAIAALRASPDVRLAVRDRYRVLHATTNDPLFGYLWGLRNLGAGVAGFGGAVADADVDADRAWDRTRGTPATVVADIDSGYRFDHPDLAGVAWDNTADPPGGGDQDRDGIADDTHGADFVGSAADTPTPDGDPTDDDLIEGGHGVHTAGTIGAAGNDGAGVTGVAQDVRIMPLRVCGPTSTSTFLTPEWACPDSAIVAAINYAGAHGARVANMSLGGLGASAALDAALAANPGVLFVASAGNGEAGGDGIGDDDDAIPTYPCASPLANVVCVAATDQADRLASFSNFGAASVDLAAPGTEILSTYPWATHVNETFEADDFAAKWRSTGADGGFARTNESPLTSFGMSDSPGAAPMPLSVRETTSLPVALPAGYSTCTLEQTRTVSLGLGDRYTYQVLLNGSTLATGVGTRSGTFAIEVTSPSLAAGGSLQLRFRYSALAPTAANGVWLDDIAFYCPEPVGQTSSHGFLDGTSMAAPHVTGAAALLFSLKPAATVAEVKSALLRSVDALPSLAGRTVTGGRLNVADALEALVPTGASPPPDTRIDSVPASGTTSTVGTFAFHGVGDIRAASFQCQLDGAAFQTCASPASFAVGVGAHAFAVRARSKFGVLDPTPASAAWTVVAPPPPHVAKCRVPKLKGTSLRRAKRALKKRHCRLGKVRRPRKPAHGRLRPLVVRGSRPRAGAVRRAGAKVRLTLVQKRRRR